MVRAAYCLPAILAALNVSGCTRIIYRPMAVPAGLTAPCVHTASPVTNGELLEAYEDAKTVIAQCNTRLEAIRGLK
jgi:hypothetical protein